MAASPATAGERWLNDVGDWLDEVVPGHGPVRTEQLVAGHSNLVVGVERAGSAGRWVLRRPPHGELAPGTHDVLREARVLAQLERGGMSRVPRVVAVAETGPHGPAYLMSRVDGVAIRTSLPRWLGPTLRRMLSERVVEVLVELHQLPTAPFVEARLGRETGYLGRQHALWVTQRDRLAARPGVRPLVDEPAVRAWLAEHLPPDQRPSVVHGDFKLDNLLISEGTGTVTALLDWEMATVGDPLADLGFLLAFWPGTAAEVVLPELTGSVTTSPGFLSGGDLVARYAELRGRELKLEDLRPYVVLALWKTALLLEASFQRYRTGDTDDPFFASLEDGVPALLASARARAG